MRWRSGWRKRQLWGKLRVLLFHAKVLRRIKAFIESVLQVLNLIDLRLANHVKLRQVN